MNQGRRAIGRRRRPHAVAGLVMTIAAALLLSACSAQNGSPEDTKSIDCRPSDALLLAFQAVPSATFVPCLSTIPVGWSFGGSQIRSGMIRFWLDSDRAGVHAVEITLTETCDTAGAVKTSTTTAPQPGIARYELPLSLPPRFAMDRFDVFAGGCITYRYAFAAGASSLLVFDADQALSFFDRPRAVRAAKDLLGLTLCGAEAPPCPG